MLRHSNSNFNMFIYSRASKEMFNIGGKFFRPGRCTLVFEKLMNINFQRNLDAIVTTTLTLT